MALETAYNETTKETAVLVGGKWQMAEQVAKNSSGSSAYLINGKWVADTPELAQQFDAAANAPRNSWGQAIKNVAEGGAKLATGVTGAIAGNVAGLGALAVDATAGLFGKEPGSVADPAAVRQKVSSALTYQPSDPESVSSRIADAPGTLIKGAGQGVARTFGAENVPYLGSILEALPEAAAAWGGARAAGAPTFNASKMGGPKSVPIPDKAAALASATAPKAKPTPEARAAEAKARAYIEDKAGLDWNQVGDSFKKTLTKIAEREGSLEKLDPKQVARVARAEKINAPITRGQATRNLEQITDEENVRRTSAGRKARANLAKQDTALHDELTRIRDKAAPGVGAVDGPDAGIALQGAGRRKVQVLKGEASRLYAEAQAKGEMAKPVQATPLINFLQEAVNRRNIPWLESAIKEYSEKAGGLTIKHMEDLRSEVAAAAGESGRKGFVAGKALGVIDDILDASNAGIYKKAREKWKAYKEEFDRQAVMRDLTTEKAGTSDRRIALEETVARVMRGSDESLQQIKTSLTRGGTAQTRRRGAAAWKKLQASVLEQMREAAAGKRKIEGEDAQLQFNSAFLDELAKIEHGGKLQTLFGPEIAKEVQALGQTVRDLRTTPADRVVGPQTAMRIFRMMEHMTKIPGVAKVAEKVREARTVRRIDTNAVSEAAAKVKKPKYKTKLKKPSAAAVATTLTYDEGDEE